MDGPQFDHIEQCDESLETASTPALLKTLNHILGPVLDAQHNTVLYDLSNCQTIDPGATVLLWYAHESSVRRGHQIWIRGQGEPIAELYEHFRHYQGTKHAPEGSTPKGLYPMRRIDNKDSMLAELAEWAQSVCEGTDATPEQVALWQMQIAEVTTNTFQHGPMHKPDQQDPYSIIAGKAAGQCVQLVALDFGSTIPRVIADVAKQHQIPDDDQALIHFACRKGITSRSVKQNQGAGLYSLVQTVNQCQGMLQILSRNGLANYCNGQEFGRTLACRHDGTPVIDGTFTVINLRI